MSAIILNNKQIPVQTVVPSLSIGEIQVSADRRSTKENKLSDAERIRRAVIPANHWTDYAATINGERNVNLTDVLRSALVSIANDRLRDTLNDNPGTLTLELSDYTIPALLAWSAETASSRGTITFTRDEVTAWFETSATRTALATKHAANPKLAGILSMVANRFGALAAKNHGLRDVEEVAKLAALINEADMESDKASLVADLLSRLEHIRKSLAAKAAEDTVSMDDL